MQIFKDFYQNYNLLSSDYEKHLDNVVKENKKAQEDFKALEIIRIETKNEEINE